MIDPSDKQTAPLPLDPPKRGRGRPKTGSAMTPAEKQRAYRERLKERNVKSVTYNEGMARLEKELYEANQRADLLQDALDLVKNGESGELQFWKKRAEDAEAINKNLVQKMREMEKG